MATVIQEQIDCLSAQELLDSLSPLGLYFKNEINHATWLFRGQGVDKPLIPSLFRKNGKIKSLVHYEINSFSNLRLAERDVLVRFFQIADKRGLVLPDDSQELRSFFELLKI